MNEFTLAGVVGIVLPLVVALFARWSGFDRDRAFYPTVLMVVASLYELFGVLGGSRSALISESFAVAGFFLLAWMGFKFSAWFVVVGLVGHGVFDYFHSRLITNPGVPAWWPTFCGTYDVVAGVVLAGLLLWQGRTGRRRE